MRVFIAGLTVLVHLFSLNFAFAARNVEVYGRDSQQIFCRSNDYFCGQTLKEKTERGANLNAQWNCQLQQGQPAVYTGFCSTNCNPAYLPPNIDTWITCQSECRMTCTLKD